MSEKINTTIFCIFKIAGAEGGNLYDIRMQNAAIIRQAGLDLFVQIGSLRFYENFGYLDYIELIRGEILTFVKFPIDL